jgi:hypothetical protein
MDTEPTKPSAAPVTEEEYYHAERAFEEYRTKGSTELQCPRCGRPFIFDDRGSGHVIRCQTDGCFVVTVRGI